MVSGFRLKVATLKAALLVSFHDLEMKVVVTAFNTCCNTSPSAESKKQEASQVIQKVVSEACKVGRALTPSSRGYIRSGLMEFEVQASQHYHLPLVVAA